MKQEKVLQAYSTQSPRASFLRPVQAFVHHPASSGLVLFAATVIALISANSGLADHYTKILHTDIGFAVGSIELKYSLLHWINDGLMAIFFLSVGLEIKREVLFGELSHFRAALLPIVAALGGAIVPTVLYILLNPTGQGAHGWGIPMATDIAFTLGVLALLGKRVPLPLKVFLTAVAVTDDLIAIVVIAVFYSHGINLSALAVGLAILAGMVVANRMGIRSLIVYLGLGVFVWLAFLQSGIHATIAGVLIALTIPAQNRIELFPLLERARHLLDRFEARQSEATPMLDDEAQNRTAREISDAFAQTQTPLQRLERGLHPWVSFVIMPIFALANAGVALSANSLDGQTSSILIGIFAGLVIGKPVGLLSAVWLMIRSGIASLPEGLRWSHLIGAACLAGIGFTMSLFLASLSFGEDHLLETSKLGILGASLIAGVLGFFLLKRIPANE